MGVQPLLVGAPDFEFRTVCRRSFLFFAIGIGERLVAAALLVLLWPIFILAGIAVALLSRRPPLIAHARVGQHGRLIQVLKLRTMWEPNASPLRFRGLVEHLSPEQVSPVSVKARNDPRVTSRFAALCRRYSIDELPQLWHVVQGHLALIGPRPLTANELQAYYDGTLQEFLSVKPGLSGLWQIRGRSRLSYRQRRRFDLFMIRHWSLSLYFMILLATIPAVLTGKDAW